MDTITLDLDFIENNKTPQIYFSEWKINKPALIEIQDILRPKIITYKHTVYYIFRGHFINENFLGIDDSVVVDFWFTLKTFCLELKRHPEILIYKDSKNKLSTQILLQRISKNQLRFNEIKFGV
jgi:hypothetical protein